MVLVHPEYALLILEVNELKEVIADLSVEKDMLVNYVCKDLEIDYMLKIGALEYKLFVAQNNLQKANRRLEIIETKLGENLPINIEEIDKKIKSEFKKQDKLEKEMLEDIDFAIDATEIQIFDYDIIDGMNVDYFKLQKMYNPIFDFEEVQEKVKLYRKIEKYYQKCNYKKIKKLAEDYNEEEMFQDEISKMKKLKEKYLGVVKEKEKEIRKIKNTFPYNQKVILKNDILCRRKKENINRQITETDLETKKIEKKIRTKLKKL